MLKGTAGSPIASVSHAIQDLARSDADKRWSISGYAPSLCGTRRDVMAFAKFFRGQEFVEHLSRLRFRRAGAAGDRHSYDEI